MLKQGRILPGIDMKIVDGEGSELPWDGVAFGDLKVHGPWVASAYYGEEPGSALDEDGWFATGDVATIDPDGFMEITDRSKDVIKSGGEWISSITLENIAVSHPDVAGGRGDRGHATRNGTSGRCCWWCPRPGKTVDPASVLALYEGKVAKWWLPDEVVVVPELPHTATGKLLKTSLRTAVPGSLRERGREISRFRGGRGFLMSWPGSAMDRELLSWGLLRRKPGPTAASVAVHR